MGLYPISRREVTTANGRRIAGVYLIGLYLLNDVVFPALPVTDGNLGNDIDVLIGMDVIGSGDFAVIRTAFETATAEARADASRWITGGAARSLPRHGFSMPLRPDAEGRADVRRSTETPLREKASSGHDLPLQEYFLDASAKLRQDH